MRDPENYELKPGDSPVHDELQRQMGWGLGYVDATRLWVAAGKPKNKSPRAWLPKDYILADTGGPASTTSVWVERDNAFTYSCMLCPKFCMFTHSLVMKRLRENPARHVMGSEGDPLITLFALSATMQNESVGPKEAAKRLVGSVVEQTEHLGVYAQEARVAEAQRAVGKVADSIIVLPAKKPPGA